TEIAIPAEWRGVALKDAEGRQVACEVSRQKNGKTRIAFVAEKVPPLGYSTYSIAPSDEAVPSEAISGRSVENDFFKLDFGDGGIKSLYDKRLKWEVFRTEKFYGGEVIQFTAPGSAWDVQPITVTMEDFDRTSNHSFSFESFLKGPVRTTAVREAKFQHF